MTTDLVLNGEQMLVLHESEGEKVWIRHLTAVREAVGAQVLLLEHVDGCSTRKQPEIIRYMVVKYALIPRMLCTLYNDVADAF